MKFTLSWLKKFLDTDASTEEITDNLTYLGFEVEKVTDKSKALSDFTVAYIKSVKPHPNASKLQICEVETTEGLLQIVCGAGNARANIKVALAKIGSIIPSGTFKIKESEIRGIKSYGMLCSEEELGISENSVGIIELPQNAIIGDNIAKYYGLDDPIIEINVTPNRGDTLGVYGIARELAAKGLGKLIPLSPVVGLVNQVQDVQDITDSSFALFVTRKLKNIHSKQSPVWLQNLLKNIGIKPISAVVDITNYIAYSYAQPMHAYDSHKLNGSLQVKILEHEVQFEALNSQKYNLAVGDLVISDNQEIQCLAGIIGSKVSACDENTKEIILEAAVFNPKYITKTGQRLQINTDSRYRFERGVDQEFTINALNIATDMILEICGATAEDIQTIMGPQPKKIIIDFPLSTIEQISGLKLDSIIILDILTKLGFTINHSNGVDLNITPPSWRHDINIKEDIVEEIVRVYGYEHIPQIPLPSINISKIIPKYYKQTENTKRILASVGYHEVITWSFMKDKEAAYFNELKEELEVINPISADLNYMRPTILPNLLKIIEKNQIRSINNLSIFESGPVFYSTQPSDETQMIAGLRCGMQSIRSWYHDQREFDIYDIKSDLETVLTDIGLNFDKLQLSTQKLPHYYHPGVSASLNLGKNTVAYFGQIHPRIQKIFNINYKIFAFELYLANLPLGREKNGRRNEFTVSDFQMSTRDFSFVIDQQIPADQLINFIHNIDKNLIKSVELFDLYTKGMERSKSISVSVKIQAPDCTLTEKSLNDLSDLIIKGVEQKFSASLRADL